MVIIGALLQPLGIGGVLMFVSLPDFLPCRPASCSVLTVTNGFALDIVEVIDVSEQRYTAKDSEHDSSDQD